LASEIKTWLYSNLYYSLYLSNWYYAFYSLRSSSFVMPYWTLKPQHNYIHKTNH